MFCHLEFVYSSLVFFSIFKCKRVTYDLKFTLFVYKSINKQALFNAAICLIFISFCPVLGSPSRPQCIFFRFRLSVK